MKFHPTNLFSLRFENGWRVFGVCPNSHQCWSLISPRLPLSAGKKKLIPNKLTRVPDVPEPKTAAMNANRDYALLIIIILYITTIGLPQVVHIVFFRDASQRICHDDGQNTKRETDRPDDDIV